MLKTIVIVLIATTPWLEYVAAQSNYADQANNIEYQGDGLPENATLDGKVTRLDDLSPVIFLNRTQAALNCASGSMQIELKFKEKFFGIAYADFDRNSACQIAGKGGFSYKLELPLKGCGTKQNPQRVFTNNIVVRFHPSLEIDGDEIITIVCRYPPPIAPVPQAAPIIVDPIAAAPAALAPLKGFQILLIICGILFLSLLLLGLGCSYYCLRRRPVTIVRHPFSSIGTDSEITKLSGSSLGNLSMFEGLKIPRAHPPVAVPGSTSGSEEPIISDTLPSDYPSESQSEEDVDTRSLPVSSAGSFENKAYVPDHHASYYTEPIPAPAPLREASPQPRFDVQVRVKKPPPPPPSLTLSDSDSARNLSTIPEQYEDSVRSVSPSTTHFTYVPELHPPPKKVQPAPTYTRILRRQQELLDEPPAELQTVTETPIAAMVVHKPEVTSHVVDDVFLRTITEKKTIEDIERHKRLITEYHTRPKLPMEPQKWDVTIKNLPIEMREPPEWENFSDVSSASGLTAPLQPRYDRVIPPQPAQISDNKLPLNSPELVGSIHTKNDEWLTTFNVPLENPHVPNWDVLIRVLQSSDDDGMVIESAETFNSQLTMTDKLKWRQIITTESTLRSKLSEAVIREDYERIRRDVRYEPLFEPVKWDVIIRILTPVERNPKIPQRYRKKSEVWDNRSRRSSLPTLYEYNDTDDDGDKSLKAVSRKPQMYDYDDIDDGGSSVKTLTTRDSHQQPDLRSMSEMTVDFRRPAMDTLSEASSYNYPSEMMMMGHHHRYYDETSSAHHPSSLVRSLSQPSLARSASEFTERWVAPSVRYDTGSEFTTPEGTPRSQRSSRIASHAPETTTGHQIVQQTTFRSEERRFVRGGQRVSKGIAGRDWFGDNDSENSYK